MYLKEAQKIRVRSRVRDIPNRHGIPEIETMRDVEMALLYLASEQKNISERFDRIEAALEAIKTEQSRFFEETRTKFSRSLWAVVSALGAALFGLISWALSHVTRISS